MNLNKAFILGRLTRDPEARTLPNGKPVSSFSIATNRVWTDSQSGAKQEQAEFHNIVAFGRLAEICNQYLTKGQVVFIEGRIQTRSWEDSGGNRRNRTEIVAGNMQMGAKPGAREGAESHESSEPIHEVSLDEDEEALEEKPKGKKGKKKGDSSGEGEIDVKDIPF